MSNDTRPLSPHLQVYRLPMLAWLSILHRATGVVLSLAALLLPAILVAVATGGETWECVKACAAAWYGQVALFAVSLALNYHLCNGVRHLFWDAGYGFKPETADKSGVFMVLAALALTAGVWAVALV